VGAQAALDEKMFVARALGKSMEPRIQDGDYLVFRASPVGTRDGKIVLAQWYGPEDPETGGAYTVKKYHSEKVPNKVGDWRHSKITLSPLSPNFSEIVLEKDQAESFKVIAEYIDKIIK